MAWLGSPHTALDQPNLVRRSLTGIDRQRQTLDVSRQSKAARRCLLRLAILLAQGRCAGLHAQAHGLATSNLVQFPRDDDEHNRADRIDEFKEGHHAASFTRCRLARAVAALAPTTRAAIRTIVDFMACTPIGLGLDGVHTGAPSARN
jgi:hypothetical protein